METLTIKIDRQWASQLRRKCKNIKLDERILLDLTGEMLVSSLKGFGAPKKSPKGRIRAIGKDDHMTEAFEISKHVAQKLHPYLMFFDISLSRIINDAMGKMQPNIIRMLPINCRSMGCLRTGLFLWENSREQKEPSSSEAIAYQKEKEAKAAKKAQLEAKEAARAKEFEEELGPEEDYEIVQV